mgnify:CR=1 FL=1
MPNDKIYNNTIINQGTRLNFLIKLLISYSLLLSSLSYANEKTIHLTSLEWPPYAGASLPQQGISIAVARAAFNAMGYDLKVTFFPWSRAVTLAKRKESKFIGYFPEYFSTQTGKDFIYSDEMGSSPLGFAERKNQSISWTKLDHLKPYRIGIVQDYINTEEFDAMIDSQSLKISSTINDAANLKKLMSQRIDLAVIDKNVMKYLFKTDPSLSQKSDSAQFNNMILENKNLYICFKKNNHGQKISDIFNQGLKKINITITTKSVIDEILNPKSI